MCGVFLSKNGAKGLIEASKMMLVQRKLMDRSASPSLPILESNIIQENEPVGDAG